MLESMAAIVDRDRHAADRIDRFDDLREFRWVHAREHARAHYGLEAEIRELPSYLDQNFLLSVGDEPTYVLKIANSDEAGSFLEGQVAALDHLQREAPGEPADRLETPAVVRAADGGAVIPMLSPGRDTPADS